MHDRVSTPGTLDVAGLLRLLIGGGAAWFVFAYLFVALTRLAYPFELEFMEGGTWVQVARILAGQPLYVPPSFEFTPFIYPPLYYYSAAGVAAITGGHFLPLRVVSLMSSVVNLALVFALVQRETRVRWAAWTAVGLYAATFVLSGGWWDLARVDTLALTWLLAALYALRSGHLLGDYGAGLLLALAWFTKQTTLVAAAGLLVATVVTHRRQGLRMGAALALSLGLGLAGWQSVSKGWFAYYVLTLPGQHTLSFDWPSVLRFLLLDVLVVLPMGVLIGLDALLSRGLPRSTRVFYAISAAGLCSMALAGRLNPGGYPNVLMPLHAMGAVLFGFGLASRTKASALPEKRSRAPWLIYAGVIAQLSILFYPIAPLLPTDQDRQAGEELLSRIRAIPGEVYVPYHNYLAALAGKTPYSHQIALGELYGSFGGGATAEWAAVREHAQAALAARRFSAIIQDHADWLQAELDRYYQLERAPLFVDPQVFRPKTGWLTRPERWYVPRLEP